MKKLTPEQIAEIIKLVMQIIAIFNPPAPTPAP